jgi:hypothetical protein
LGDPAVLRVTLSAEGLGGPESGVQTLDQA